MLEAMGLPDSPKLTNIDVHKRYLKLAKRLHPDAGGTPDAAKFALVTDAYNGLLERLQAADGAPTMESTSERRSSTTTGQRSPVDNVMASEEMIDEINELFGHVHVREGESLGGKQRDSGGYWWMADMLRMEVKPEKLAESPSAKQPKPGDRKGSSRTTYTRKRR